MLCTAVVTGIIGQQQYNDIEQLVNYYLFVAVEIMRKVRQSESPALNLVITGS